MQDNKRSFVTIRWRAALVLAAIGAAWAPLPSWAIERVYSGGLYLALQPALTSASNAVGFALFDLLISAALAGWLFLLGRDVARRSRGGWPRVFARLAARTLGAAAGFYLLFLLTWGLNYRRVPLAEKLQFDAHAVSSEAARRAALAAADRLNALHGPAHDEGSPADGAASSLATAFARVQQELGAKRLAVPGRPKRTLLEPYLRRTAVDGMTDPYFLETLVSADLLAVERPFVVAHEWSHLAGFADESEANFVGWLTCLRGSASDQYSGWLFLYTQLSRVVDGRSGAELEARLHDGPREDLRAIARRVERHISPRLAAAGWRVYDQYLKANRVERGAASYAEVVRLVLGVRFSPAGVPLRR